MKGIRLAATVVSVTASMASLLFLLGVYRWAKDNSTTADREHELFIFSAMVVCALLAFPVVAAIIFGNRTLPHVVRAGSAGAFVAVALSCAATLLIAISIKDATDPGEFGRPLFRVAYVGALLLSLSIGTSAAWAAQPTGSGSGSLAASIVLAVAMTFGSWAYLAIGSSEMNTCVVDDEFPLATNFVCSGY